MELALTEAQKASQMGEVPVGAVIVRDGEILATAHNLRESMQSPSAHAELLAIEAAAKKINNWRLENTQLFVTLEPCLMCWGSIVLARIPQVYFGAADPKAGVCGSVLSLHEETRFNHRPKVNGGVLANECGATLTNFFQGLRVRNCDRLTAKEKSSHGN